MAEWQLPSMQAPNIIGSYMQGRKFGQDQQDRKRQADFQERKFSLLEREEKRAAEAANMKQQKLAVDLLIKGVDFASDAPDTNTAVLFGENYLNAIEQQGIKVTPAMRDTLKSIKIEGEEISFEVGGDKFTSTSPEDKKAFLEDIVANMPSDGPMKKSDTLAIAKKHDVSIDKLGEKEKPLSKVGKEIFDYEQTLGPMPVEDQKKKYMDSGKGTSEAELTRASLKGDPEAKAILNAMQDRKIDIARAGGEAMIDAKIGVVDTEGVARAVIDGRETIENVKNTFGVPVQEAVRAAVLEKDPEFNFVKPRIKLAAVKSSLMLQQKQRGMMGSFVKNLNKQLTRVDTVIKDVISRIGVRGIDLPLRELNVRFKGSGHEKVLESYLIEISNEIGKLSTGSSASIRELSTDAQERWAKIHDPNLSFKELKKILDETQTMANMRLDSTDEEINETLGMLDNIREERKPSKKEKPKRRFKILSVE